MSNSVTIKGLTKSYKTFKLGSIDLELPKGRIMGLVGENGAGKSTLIKTMLGIVRKDSGTVDFWDKDYNSNRVNILDDMGVVFEDCYYQGKLTPKNIEQILKSTYTNFDSNKYNDFLLRFKLEKDKKIEEFSRGMKMKLSIATALSHNPKILIMDEATSGLDPVVRDEILDLFLEFIEDEDRSILFSSHITTDLERIADYITFIADGKIVFSKSKDELLYDYGIIRCDNQAFTSIDKEDILVYRQHNNGYEALVEDKQAAQLKYRDAKGVLTDKTSIDEIILLYSKGEVQ